MPNQWGKDELFSKWFVISKEPCWKKKKKRKKEREKIGSIPHTIHPNKFQWVTDLNANDKNHTSPKTKI